MKLPAKYIKNKNSISINEPYNSQIKKKLPYIFKQSSFIKKVKKWSIKYMGIYEPSKKKQEAIQNITHYVSTVPSIIENL